MTWTKIIIFLPLLALSTGFISAAEKALECVQIPVKEKKGPLRPLSYCLPPALPKDYFEKSGFIHFEPEDTEDLPLGDSAVFLDGEIQTENEVLDKIFWHEHGALLPSSQTILISSAGKREVWTYPLGTRVIHKISWVNSRETYELRMIEKLSNEMWAYGIYVPDPKNPDRLILRKDGAPKFSRKIQILSENKPKQYLLEMKRIHSETCRNCHSNHSSAWYQYGMNHPVNMRWNYAGPCSFAPGNPHLKTDWRKTFKAANGYDPFLEN